MNNPTPRFTGIFIPIEILELDTINAMDKILLSWIDALYCKDHKGCYASNEYIATKLNLEANTVAKILTKLRKLNLIEDVSFDGRKRVIRSLVNSYVDECQRKPELDGNPTPIGQLSNPSLDDCPSYPIVESKDYNKGEEKPLPPPPSKKKKAKEFIPKVLYGPFVALKEGEYEALCTELGKDLVDHYIKAINLYVPNRKGASYKDYASTIRAWHMKDESNGSLPVKKSSSGLPKDPFDKLVENKAISERIRAIVEPECNDSTYFLVKPTYCIFKYGPTNFEKEYPFSAEDPKAFKERMISNLIKAFPKLKEKLNKFRSE